MIQSLLRIEEIKALSKLSLNGKILDLGGEKDAYYQKVIGGKNTFTVVNLDEKTKPDFYCDLEKFLPFKEGEYDHIIIINVLEHIYNYRGLIEQSYKIIKNTGSVCVVVPFMFPFHSSPRDYFRYTSTALRQIFIGAGFVNVQIKSVGSGVFASCFLGIDRLLPYLLRFLNYHLTRHIIYLLDISFEYFANFFHKKYKKSDYALGYIVTANK